MGGWPEESRRARISAADRNCSRLGRQDHHPRADLDAVDELDVLQERLNGQAHADIEVIGFDGKRLKGGDVTCDFIGGFKVGPEFAALIPELLDDQVEDNVQAKAGTPA